MDIESIVSQLSQQSELAGKNVQTTLVGGINDPAKMLQSQFEMMQYNNLIGYSSALMDAIKKMVIGIIQKI